MTTDRGDAGSTPVGTTGGAGGGTGGTDSPYEIGFATDDARGTDETGPQPLDPEHEDEQVRGDA
ncbi:MAG: hypothetical protein M3P95_12835 [Actinomycetota bacterium]|nr:hypothetical protein [Actinomycetota bacterium]